MHNYIILHRYVYIFYMQLNETEQNVQISNPCILGYTLQKILFLQPYFTCNKKNIINLIINIINISIWTQRKTQKFTETYLSCMSSGTFHIMDFTPCSKPVGTIATLAFWMMVMHDNNVELPLVRIAISWNIDIDGCKSTVQHVQQAMSLVRSGKTE